MAEEEKIKIELTPFEALTILTLVEMLGRRLPKDDKLSKVIASFETQVRTNITNDQIGEAFVEKEIYEALLNLNK